VKMQTLSLARAREHIQHSNTAFFSFFLKATFNGRRKELSLSLHFRAKPERKRYRGGVSFPSFISEKIKKNKHPPQKREKKFSLFFQHRLFLPPRFGWGPKNVSLPTMMMCAQTNAPPYNKQQRERRADFKLAQKQPNVMHCYDASGRARVRTRCGSDRARFTHFFSPLQIPVIKLSLFSSLFRVK